MYSEYEPAPFEQEEKSRGIRMVACLCSLYPKGNSNCSCKACCPYCSEETDVISDPKEFKATKMVSGGRESCPVSFFLDEVHHAVECTGFCGKMIKQVTEIIRFGERGVYGFYHFEELSQDDKVALENLADKKAIDEKIREVERKRKEEIKNSMQKDYPSSPSVEGVYLELSFIWNMPNGYDVLSKDSDLLYTKLAGSKSKLIEVQRIKSYG